MRTHHPLHCSRLYRSSCRARVTDAATDEGEASGKVCQTADASASFELGLWKDFGFPVLGPFNITFNTAPWAYHGIPAPWDFDIVTSTLRILINLGLVSPAQAWQASRHRQPGEKTDHPKTTSHSGPPLRGTPHWTGTQVSSAALWPASSTN